MNTLSLELIKRGWKYDPQTGDVKIPWEEMPSTPAPASCSLEYAATYHNASQMPMRYKQTGAAVAAGTKGQVKKISAGRKKHRGMASEDFNA